MQVKDITRYNIQSIQINDNVFKASQLMALYKIGAIAVFDNNKAIGILTEHDIVKKNVNEAFPPAQTLVGSAMSTGVIACNENCDIAEALSLMIQHRISSLLVKNNDDSVIGILSF